MDAVCRRAVTLPERRRLRGRSPSMALPRTSSALPIRYWRARGYVHRLCSTAFPDGVGEACGSGLEQVIAREGRISLMMGDKEQRFTVTGNCGEAGAVSRFVDAGCAR